MSICALPLWQFDWPKIERWVGQLGCARLMVCFRRGYKGIGLFINVLAVASLIYAPISIFRLNYTLTAAVVVVTLQQLAAPNRVLSAGAARERPNLYEMMKAKLE